MLQAPNEGERFDASPLREGAGTHLTLVPPEPEETGKAKTKTRKGAKS